MEIRQMKYLIRIVDEDCNLSKAASKLYITQPALSRAINEIETVEGIQIFVRKNKRLVSLTPTGRMLYEKSRETVDIHNKNMEMIHEMSLEEKDCVRIGINDLLLSACFSRVFPECIKERPESTLIVKEVSADIAERMFQQYLLDIVILLQPTQYDFKGIEKAIIFSVPLVAFLSDKHPLVKQSLVTWDEISQYPLSIPHKEHIIHRLLKQKFMERHLLPNIKILSDSWTYLFLSVRTPDFITILPPFCNVLLQRKDIVSIPIDNPLMWTVQALRHTTDHSSEYLDFVFEKIRKVKDIIVSSSQ